jgi:hypothetical protein
MIEIRQCENEYRINECDKVSFHESPILIQLCKDLNKCIESHFTNVFMHRILIKMVKDIFNGIFGNLFNSYTIILSLLLGAILLKFKLIN